LQFRAMCCNASVCRHCDVNDLSGSIPAAVGQLTALTGLCDLVQGEELWCLVWLVVCELLCTVHGACMNGCMSDCGVGNCC